MAATTSSATGHVNSSTGLSFPEYFTALAKGYTTQTGKSTRTLFKDALPEINSLLPITKDSVIHDNAAGPGIATSVLVDSFEDAETDMPQILATDNNTAMVTAAHDSFTKFPSVTAKELNSEDLAGIPDDHFTHSILNFSAQNVPGDSFKEMYRTLRPGGLAIVLSWSLFGGSTIIHAAQKRIRPDLPLLPVPRSELLAPGALESVLSEAGFSQQKMRTDAKTFIAKGENLEGLRSLANGNLMAPARNGYTADELARWPAAVDEVLKEETAKHGGVKFEAWVILALK